MTLNKMAISLLEKCIEITEKTEYNVHFDYAGHVNAFCINLSRKSKLTPLYSLASVVGFGDDEWRTKEREQVFKDLDDILNGTYHFEWKEIVNA
jgi:hypothetical protein